MDKMKRIIENLYNSTDDEGNVRVIGTVTSGDMASYKLPETEFNLHVPLDSPMNIGEKITISTPVENLLEWIPFALAFEAIRNRKNESEKSVVYVLLMENGTVKIGRSKNFEQRKVTISTSSGMIVKKHWHTKEFTMDEASKIETRSHKHFKADRVKGEFFAIDFEEACAYVEKLATTRDSLP